MRCIDADALVAKMNLAIAMLKRTMKNFDIEDDPECQMELKAYQDIRDGIKEEPTIEPERKKGKWIHGREIAREMIGDCTTAIFYDGWTCSECGCLVERECEPLYKYCPQCGSYNGG